MSSQQSLTARQAAIIIEHNNRLIEGAEIDLMNLRGLPDSMLTPDNTGMIEYWRHAIKALKWSNAIAKQRIKATPNAPIAP